METCGEVPCVSKQGAQIMLHPHEKYPATGYRERTQDCQMVSDENTLVLLWNVRGIAKLKTTRRSQVVRIAVKRGHVTRMAKSCFRHEKYGWASLLFSRQVRILTRALRGTPRCSEVARQKIRYNSVPRGGNCTRKTYLANRGMSPVSPSGV